MEQTKVENTEVKKIRKASWKLTFEEAKKLPKVKCKITKNISKRTSQPIYTLAIEVRNNIKFEQSLKEKVAYVILAKNGITPFSNNQRMEYREFAGYIQFGKGISKDDKEYYRYSVYTCDIHHVEAFLDDFDLFLIQEQMNVEINPLKITWLEFEKGLDLEMFQNYEIED